MGACCSSSVAPVGDHAGPKRDALGHVPPHAYPHQTEFTAEHARWLQASSVEDAYWSAQSERFDAVLGRAQTALRSAKDLKAYLTRLTNLLAVMRKHIDGLGAFGVDETGTVLAAANAVDGVRQATIAQVAAMQGQLTGTSLKAASSIVEQASKLLASIEKTGGGAMRALQNQRQATTNAWTAYYEAGQERAKLLSVGTVVKGDPFLLARNYEQQLDLLQTNEAKFQKLMTTLLKDLQSADTKRLTAMKALLVDNLTSQKALTDNTGRATESALQMVYAIQPDTDLQQFLQSEDLHHAAEIAKGKKAKAAPAKKASAAAPASSPPKAAAAVAAANVPFLSPPPARDPTSLTRVFSHEVAKEGSLFRQGRIFSSNWKSAHAVLTTSGFLHLFDEAPNVRRTKAPVSFSLGDATVNAASGMHPHAFSVRFYKSNLFGGVTETSVFFRASSQAELDTWREEMEKYTRKPAPAPPAAAPASPHDAQAAHLKRAESAADPPMNKVPAPSAPTLPATTPKAGNNAE